MRTPPWYSRRYPQWSDLDDFAWAMNAVIQRGPIDFALIEWSRDPNEVTVICLPDYLGPLETTWLCCHELAHLVLHEGYSNPWSYGRQERQADVWAACAMIPEAAVRRHKNACQDAFVAALSAHFEDLPPIDCRAREVAGVIARIRLSMVEDRQSIEEEAV